MTGVNIKKRNIYLYILCLLSFLFIYLLSFIASIWSAPNTKLTSPILKGFRPLPLGLELPKLKKTPLSYGASLIQVKNDELPLIDLTMHFENGTAHEPISRAGILEASLALLKKGGSKSQKGEAFSKLLTNTGIILELSQNEDYWSLHLKVIRKNFKQAMNILSELLLEPALPPEVLKNIKNSMLIKIKRKNEKARWIAKRVLREILYPKIRSGYSLRETDIMHLNQESIAAELKIRCNPENMFITASGDIEGLELKKHFEKLIKQLAKSRADALSSKPKLNNPNYLKRELPISSELKKQNAKYINKILLIEKDLSQAVIQIGGYLPAHRHPDFYALQVGNYILGGGSFTSRLVQKIRVEHGLAYYVYSHNSFGKKNGLFSASAGVQVPKLAQALSLVLKEISIIQKENISQKELKLAKDSILNSMVFQFDSANKIVNQEVRFRIHQMPKNYLRKFITRIRSTKTSDIKKISKYWNVNNLYIVVVGPRKLKKNLEKIAPVIIKKLDEKLF